MFLVIWRFLLHGIIKLKGRSESYRMSINDLVIVKSQRRRASWRSKPTSKKKKESSCDRSIEILVIDVILPLAQDSSVPFRPFSTMKKRRKSKTAESLDSAFQLPVIWKLEQSLFRQSASVVDIFRDHCFLGLLVKGSKDTQGYWSSVINITSISGILKGSNWHKIMYVWCSYYCTVSNSDLVQIYTNFYYNSVKAAASHLTQLLSTEIGLMGVIHVRVNAIAPGAYETEMSSIGDNSLPIVPAKRAVAFFQSFKAR